MASRLLKLKGTAVQASQAVMKQGCQLYKQVLEKNKQYIVEPPTAEKCQELSKKLLYMRLTREKGRQAKGINATLKRKVVKKTIFENDRHACEEIKEMKLCREIVGDYSIEPAMIPKATWMADGTRCPGTLIHFGAFS